MVPDGVLSVPVDDSSQDQCENEPDRRPGEYADGDEPVTRPGQVGLVIDPFLEAIVLGEHVPEVGEVHRDDGHLDIVDHSLHSGDDPQVLVHLEGFRGVGAFFRFSGGGGGQPRSRHGADASRGGRHRPDESGCARSRDGAAQKPWDYWCQFVFRGKENWHQ